MPNCNEHHENCVLRCSCLSGYYCHDQTHEKEGRWKHVPQPDMPDDPEAYRNERAEQML